MSIVRKWIKKLWYIYTMEYYSAIKRSTFESVLMRWTKLEPIILSEVSQKEKYKWKSQWGITSHLSECLSSKSLQITSVDEVVQEQEQRILVHCWWDYKLMWPLMESNTEVRLKAKNITRLWSSNFTPGFIPRKNENTNSKWYLHPLCSYQHDLQ